MVWIFFAAIQGCFAAASPADAPSVLRIDLQKVEAIGSEVVLHLAGTSTNDIPLVLEFAPYLKAEPTQAAVVPMVPRPSSPSRNLGSVSTWTIPRELNRHDRIYSSFALGATNAAGQLELIGTNHFVEGFSNVSRFTEPFPQTASKKGLQVQMVDDALQLGIKHAALNVNLTGLIDLENASQSFPWSVDGSTIWFRRGPVEGLDRQVRALTDGGVVVTFILLTYASGNAALDRVMLHPGYDPKAPNHLAGFNAETADGVRYLRGCLEFLADRYSNPTNFGGRVANYILGNEVNSHWFWSNIGRVSMETFAESYLRAVRLAHTAIRKASSSARLYVSLEHHWSIRYPGGDTRQAFAGRSFLEYFNRRAREQGNFEWHVAFHPYPENLFEPRTWNDRSATTNNDTPRITFKNLQVLERFLGRPELRWADAPRRVILSEQGFHTVDRSEGELWQAAAYAYAYYKAAHSPGIDAFILHRHVDHGQEGGLRLGLWSRDTTATFPAAPKTQKKIYELFRVADTPAWETAAAFALPVIGVERWEDLLPPEARRLPEATVAK